MAWLAKNNWRFIRYAHSFKAEQLAECLYVSTRHGTSDDAIDKAHAQLKANHWFIELMPDFVVTVE